MENSTTDAPFEARFQLNQSDIKASEKLALQGTKTLTLQRVVRAIIAFAALVFVASVVFNRTMANRAATPREAAIWDEGLGNNFVVFVLVVLFIVIWKLVMVKKRNALYKTPMLREPTAMTFDQNALTRQCGESFNRIEWPNIARVIMSDAHLLLMTSDTTGFIVPRRAFGCEADYQRFVDFAREQWQKNRPATPPIADV